MQNESNEEKGMPNQQTTPSTDPPTEGPGTSPGGIKKGYATKFWLELVPYPTKTPKSLWLWIKDTETWCHYDDPPPNMEASVQSAFSYQPNRFQVLVWYDQNNVIVGLVVRSTDA